MRSKKQLSSRGLSVFSGLLIVSALVFAPSITPRADAYTAALQGTLYRDEVANFGVARTLGIGTANPRASYTHSHWDDPSHIYTFSLLMRNTNGTIFSSASFGKETKGQTVNFAAGPQGLPKGVFYLSAQFRLVQGFTGSGWRTFNGTLNYY